MRKIFTVFFLCLFLTAGFAATAEAQLSVTDAKARGLVGERPDGLLGIVQSAPGVNELVSSTNAQRLDRYRQVAQGNNTPLDQVQALAGERLMNETPRGQYIFLNGRWVQK
ncbi:MAG: DUF1318 domain-containing protein [Micavibrio sp.]|nr:MAG: DUF1318 domain-containing protein [Micavibrio sp.]